MRIEAGLLVVVAELAPGTAQGHNLPRAKRQLGLQGLREEEEEEKWLLIKVAAGHLYMMETQETGKEGGTEHAP